MRVPRLGTLVLIVFGMMLLVGGCNVFGVANVSPNTVDALLADARFALNAGRTSRAVGLLERAFRKDSTDVRVRVELGNALFADRGVDVFTLRAGGRYLVGSLAPAGTLTTPRASPSLKRPVCTNGAQPDESSDRYVALPLDADPVRVLVEHRNVVDRVHELVVEGVLRRRAEAFSEARVDLRQKGLLVGAFALTIREVIHLHDNFKRAKSTLFLDRGGEPERALLACAKTKKILQENNRALCALSTAARQGVDWLRRRNQLSEGNRETFLTEPLHSLAVAASARPSCSLGSARVPLR